MGGRMQGALYPSWSRVNVARTLLGCLFDIAHPRVTLIIHPDDDLFGPRVMRVGLDQGKGRSHVPGRAPFFRSIVLPSLVLALLPFALVLAAGQAVTQEGGEAGAPRLNQPGKDVQWVPTPLPLVDKMLDLAELTPKDSLVDLGSGDGVLVIAAAKRGIRAWGIEYDRGLVEYARRKAREAGVGGSVKFVRGDIFKTDFSSATVVTTFLLPSMNLQLRPTFLRMKPGTRIVANTFAIAGWEPDTTVELDQPCERWCKAMLWVVPAPVGGTWKTPKGDLVLTQKFQIVEGTLGKDTIESGRLRGATITFAAGGITYSGRVDGPRMSLTSMVDGKSAALTATVLASVPR